MKKVVFILFAAAASVSVVSAGVVSNSVYAFVQQEKVKIKAEELPDAVKKTLGTEEYTGWTVDTAYKYTADNSYEVTLKNGTETKTVKFDKEGKKID